MNNITVVSQSVALEIGRQLTDIKKGLELTGKTEIKAQDILTDDEHQFITAGQLAKIETRIGSNDPISNNTVIFSQAAARTNITSGEKLSALFGKVMKFFTDLKTVAFTGSYTDLANRPTLGTAASQAVVNNCTTTVAGSVLDARQGQVLQANINTVNSNLGTIQKSFQDGCSTIAAAITKNGVPTANNAAPAVMASNINLIMNKMTLKTQTLLLTLTISGGQWVSHTFTFSQLSQVKGVFSLITNPYDSYFIAGNIIITGNTVSCSIRNSGHLQGTNQVSITAAGY